MDENKPVVDKTASDYIITCQKEGISDHTEVCNSLHQRLKRIDVLLHEADGLRLERANILNMLRSLGDVAIKKNTKEEDYAKLDLDDDSEEAREIQNKICSALKEFGPLTNREVIQKVGGYQQEREFFRAIKYLAQNGIITKDKNRKLLLVDGN